MTGLYALFTANTMVRAKQADYEETAARERLARSMNPRTAQKLSVPRPFRKVGSTRAIGAAACC
jgi:hypothetical protein